MVILALALAASLSVGEPSAAARDWAASLRGDAAALHADIAANHAGPVNADDPGFTRLNDAGLARALDRGNRVHDFPGYLFALREYVARFDDGHVQMWTTPAAPPLKAQWPGFMTTFDASGRQIVAARAEDAPVPLGAELRACDGVPAAELAARNVGAFTGRWFLPSTRAERGWRMFTDLGNPFIARPVRCRFRIGSTVRSVRLAWRPLDDGELNARVAEVTRRVRTPIAARTWPDGTRWYTLSGFEGDPAGDDAKALTPLIAAMRRDMDEIAKAPRIVLDLRGNNGGSSSWSQQIAEILWGPARVETFGRDVAVDWRASPDNLKTLQGYRARFAAAMPVDQDAVRYYDRLAAGMAQALARRQAFFHETDEPEPARPSVAPTRLRGPVFFVTDHDCASACLDAADLWKAMGAIQVGEETSADTLYMDLREDDLPSGLVGVGVPMKVYRGRARGSNIPLRPTRKYHGDMRDTDALHRWIATLPANRG